MRCYRPLLREEVLPGGSKALPGGSKALPGNEVRLEWERQGSSILLEVYLRTSLMAAELDFSPPEIPEPTFMENILHYGLFFGAIFQLICVLAIILPVPKTYKMDAESFETKSAEVVKKPKIAALSVNKKLKKETKKKR